MRRAALTGLLVCLSTAPLTATSLQLGPHQQLAEDIFRELIGFRSSALYPAQIKAAADAMAERLLAAGFDPADVQVVSPGDSKGTLVARYRGTGARRPLLLMAHIDVVDAEPDAWAFPPFEFGNDGTWYFGRGTVDNKAGAATLVANFLRLRAEGFVPERDLIMVLSGDEETEGAHIDWLVNTRRDLVDAELALNTDAGGGAYDDNGEPQQFSVQTSEKIYQSFELRTTSPGGHSSVPGPDNAIYGLTTALGKIGAYQFPLEVAEATQVSLERSADLELDPERAADMRATAAGDLDAAQRLAARSDWDNAQLRTTCVATRLAAGHADNALPRSASAIVNCRILPTQTPDEVEAKLRSLVGDDTVAFRRVEQARPSPPSPLTPALLETIEAVVAEMWPGTPVIPGMSTGATDGLFVRNAGIPVYGVSAIFAHPDEITVHGLDEKIGIAEFHRAVEYWYRMIKALSR